MKHTFPPQNTQIVTVQAQKDSGTLINILCASFSHSVLNAIAEFGIHKDIVNLFSCVLSMSEIFD